MNKIREHGAWLAISEAHDGFNIVLSTLQNPNENPKHFEIRFAASVLKLNSRFYNTRHPSRTAALMYFKDS